MSQCQYRRTKAGEWVVMGPVNVVQPGAVVQVTKKDGSTKDETIVSIGKPFDAQGVAMVYGHTSHGWQAKGPYQARGYTQGGKTFRGSDKPKEQGQQAQGQSQVQTQDDHQECHLCLASVSVDRLAQAWCEGAGIGCADHGTGDLCLACDDCRGEGEK